VNRAKEISLLLSNTSQCAQTHAHIFTGNNAKERKSFGLLQHQQQPTCITSSKVIIMCERYTRRQWWQWVVLHSLKVSVCVKKRFWERERKRERERETSENCRTCNQTHLSSRKPDLSESSLKTKSIQNF